MNALRRESLIWGLVGAVALTLFVVYRVEKPETITPVSVLVIIESTVTIIGVIYAVFIGFGWHLPIFKGWLVRVPNVRGTWRGHVLPLDSEGQQDTPIQCQLIIRQRLSSVNCILHTAGARSQSFAGNAYLDEDSGEERLVYVYRTNPKLAQRVSNASHDGSTILVLRSTDVLVGTYFTDRCTRGELCLSLLSRKTNIPLL